MVFDIPRRGVNGLLGLEVRGEDGDVLWSRRFHYEKGRRIPYGGAVELRGRTVTVTVVYPYDRLVACAGTLRKTLSIP